MRRRFTMNKGFTETFDFNNYLTIEALEDNLTVTFTNNIEYGIDGKGWLKLKAFSESQPINNGQTLSFKGEFTPSASNGIGVFTINKKCNLKGNCMSMLFGDNATNNYSLSGKKWAFYELFYNCSNIVNVSSNFLPATTLAAACYRHMFANCTSLTTVPELPATTLADSCYGYMFKDCTSLTTAPALPATTLAVSCYNSMFENCTSLTTAPALPATTLADYCYGYMFYNCTKLNYIKMLATNISAYDCLYYWVRGVSSTGTFVKNTAMTSLPTGVSGIPSGWTVQNA